MITRLLKSPIVGTEKSSDKQWRRFIYAVLVLVVFAAVFVIACSLSRSVGADVQQDSFSGGSSYVAAIKDEVLVGGDLQTSLAEVGFYPVDTTEVPEWFEEEVLERDKMVGGMASPDWSIIGFSRQGDADEVLTTLTKTFSEKGWQGFDSGMAGVATFIKEKGTCSWLMINCIETGNAISVVLQIQHT